MKLTKLGLFITICLIASIAFAQAPDTVVVDPGVGTLNEAVANSDNQGKVFKLKGGELGVYILNADINNIGWHLQVVGEKGDIPPRIVRDTENDRDHFFAAEGDLTLKNLFLIYRAINGAPMRGEVISIYEDSVDVTIEKVIKSEGYGTFVRIREAAMVNLLVKDCMLFNSFHPTNHQSGGWFVWIRGDHTGSYKVVNNTVFNVNGPLFLNHWKRFDLVENVVVEHNTICLNMRHIFAPMFAIKNYVIKNNLFVDPFARGYVGPGDYKGVEYAGDFVDNFDKERPGNEYDGLFAIDTLAAEWGVAEEDRYIEISNNVVYFTQKIKDWHDAVGAITMPWFNKTSQEMFDAYDNFLFKNNVEGVDPVLANPLSGEFYDLFIEYEDRFRMGETMPDRSWDPDGDADPFTWPWPLPLDLSFQYNTEAQQGWDLAGDDGYPVGDLNWFPSMKSDWEAGSQGPLTPISTDVASQPTETPKEYQLSQNYPNPFNPTTTIKYGIKNTDHVKLTVFNMLGQKIKTLVNENVKAGSHQVTWNGTNELGQKVSNGIYFYRLESGKFSQTMKMLLLK
ncbi:T9SS type A sorting domain-containing protein [candidate division KSB1 bacterium]|nr:T9SS type A sorting domain-containing protein [candidate division KSB1 bacterium]